MNTPVLKSRFGRALWGALALALAFSGLPAAGAESRHVLRNEDFVVTVTVDSESMKEKFGPRFDRTGAVTSLIFKGVEYLASIGLADEFGLDGVGVLGFAEAGGEGGSFLKIGVGELSRYAENNYVFWVGYPVRTLFPVEVEEGAEGRSLTLTQKSPQLHGYAYRYSKSYTLVAPATLVVSYRLENTGEETFTVSHYNHNWLRFDDAEPDADYRVQTAFPRLGELTAGLVNTDEGLGLTADAKGAYWAFDGKIAPEANWMWVRRGELAMEIAGDFEASRFALWVGEGGFCPEVFGLHTVEPGQVAQWQRTYRALAKSNSRADAGAGAAIHGEAAGTLARDDGDGTK